MRLPWVSWQPERSELHLCEFEDGPNARGWSTVSDFTINQIGSGVGSSEASGRSKGTRPSRLTLKFTRRRLIEPFDKTFWRSGATPCYAAKLPRILFDSLLPNSVDTLCSLTNIGHVFKLLNHLIVFGVHR